MVQVQSATNSETTVMTTNNQSMEIIPDIKAHSTIKKGKVVPVYFAVAQQRSVRVGYAQLGCHQEK
jgi:hypothetical protein